METNEIFGYLGVAPESDGGQPGQGGTADPQAQSGAAPGEQGQPAGERGQSAGIAAPAASQGAQGEQQGGQAPGGQGGQQEGTTAGGRPAMSPEQRARNAQRRRQQETQAAVQRALQEERQRQEQNLADIFREIGLRDGKGQPITNVEELRSWKQAADLARVQKELKSGTLSADGLSALVREALRQSGQIQNGPEGGAPRQTSEAFAEEGGGARERGETQRTAGASGEDFGPTTVTQEQVDQELAEIHRLDPSVETLEDIMGMDTRDAFVAAVRRGNSFLDAFRLANFDRLQESRRQETAQRAAQAERNRTRSKEHMTATGTRGEGSVAVPTETLELYRQLMPKATDAEISAHYNRTIKDIK